MSLGDHSAAFPATCSSHVMAPWIHKPITLQGPVPWHIFWSHIPDVCCDNYRPSGVGHGLTRLELCDPAGFGRHMSHSPLKCHNALTALLVKSTCGICQSPPSLIPHRDTSCTQVHTHTHTHRNTVQKPFSVTVCVVVLTTESPAWWGSWPGGADSCQDLFQFDIK